MSPFVVKSNSAFIKLIVLIVLADTDTLSCKILKPG
jgi:hypothetical protein